MTGTSAAVQATCRRSTYRPYRPDGRKAKYGRFSVLPRPVIYRNLRIKDSVKIDFACGTGGFLTSWLKELKIQAKRQRMKQNTAIPFMVLKKQFPYMLYITNMLLHDLDDCLDVSFIPMANVSDDFRNKHTIRARGINSRGNVWSEYNPGILAKLVL